MIVIRRIKKFLLYSGVDYFDYELAKPRIYQSNVFVAALISLCATFLITFMYISTFFVQGVMQNRMVYMIGAITSSLVTMLAFFYGRTHAWAVMPLVYAAQFIFYAYGILIGTITDPEQKTVTFIAMLVFLPVLFIHRPISAIITTGIYVTIFVSLCFKTKTGAVLQNDVIDAIVFGVLGLISGIIISRMKIYGYVLEQKLKEVSRFDQLTQMNNRNSYELTLSSIASHAAHSLACIYVDVNGLHELNNKEGHASGDEMLKFIAEQIKMFFGEDLSFRVGGDEFVIFVPDTGICELEQDINMMVKKIEKEGYHVATGCEVMSTHYLSLDNLIKSAESKMYQSKKQFYKNKMYDRRRG